LADATPKQLNSTIIILEIYRFQELMSAQRSFKLFLAIQIESNQKNGIFFEKKCEQVCFFFFLKVLIIGG
jgi:hypothetical protein